MNTIHLTGSAHLDPIWLWRWQDGCNEVLQTFRSALDRLSEYDCFVFTCSSAKYYQWVEEIEPAMFSEIVERVKEGRWIPVNGWYVQPDCNIPSGESFARQSLYSQLYYYEKFGRICETGYNVDSFGHNGNLPQLVRKGGMNGYVMMRPSPNENPDMPENFFWWQGTDGTRVLTYRIHDSYGVCGENSLNGQIEYFEGAMEKKHHDMALFYGVGNHGGGPTRGDIEYLMSIAKRDGRAELKFSDPDTFIKAARETMVDYPVWTDDLQHHASGCYSATSLVKKENRRLENLLYGAEAFDTIAAKLAECKPETEKFRDAWQKVSFNQFHDILCGCSIMEAYDDVRDSMGYAATIAAESYNRAALRIARRIDTWIDGVSDPVREVRNEDGGHKFPRPVVLFNPLSYPVKTAVRVFRESSAVYDSDKKPVLFQNVRSSRSNDSHLDTMFIADIPAFGYATYWLSYDEKADEIPSDIKTAGTLKKINKIKTEGYAEKAAPEKITIENENIRVTFAPSNLGGGITELLDKKSGHEYCGGKMLGIPTVIDDFESDTWAHNIFKFHKIRDKMTCESAELIESGAARAVVRVTYVYNGSRLTEDFILAASAKTLRVKCKALWQEKYCMLKLPFDIGGEDAISTYHIPGSFIKRPCNGEEEPAGKWADITAEFDGKRFGLSILNDSKYSYDCPETELRLTALRNVIFADHYSDRPDTEFNFCDDGIQRFEYGIYLHEGEAEASAVASEGEKFNIRPVVVLESYHKGGLPQTKSFITADAENVCVTALKYCEDGSGDLILRMYETAGKQRTRVCVMSDLFDFGFFTDIHAHEYKTFRINSVGDVLDCNFLEGIV